MTSGMGTSISAINLCERCNFTKLSKSNLTVLCKKFGTEIGYITIENDTNRTSYRYVVTECESFKKKDYETVSYS